MTKFKAGMLLFSMTILWGVSFPVTQIIIQAGLHPNLIVFFRGCIYLVCCIIFFFKTIVRIKRKEFIIGVIAGLFNLGGFVLQTLGIEYTTPSNAAFLTAMNVVMVPFVAWLIYKEKPNKRSFISVPVCVVGIAVLTNVFVAGNALNIGDLYSILCALCFAVMIAFLSHTAKQVDFRVIAFVLSLVQVAGTAAMLPFTGQVDVASIRWETVIPLLLFLGFFASFVTGFSQVKAQQVLAPTTAALVMSCESIFAGAFSVMLGQELFTYSLLCGGALIFSSIVIMECGIKREKDGKYMKN